MKPTSDIVLLFITRILRMFAYGFLSIILALYLTQVGLSESQIGLLLTLTLAGDAGITLWITTTADRIGRRRMLMAGALLMILAGGMFLLTRDPVLLTLAAIIGVISPSGNEIGPFLSIEQAGLTQLVSSENRTNVFAWYNLVGSFATASGALAGGWAVAALQSVGQSTFAAYQIVLLGYVIAGGLLMICFWRLSPRVEISAQGAANAPQQKKSTLGLHQSRNIIIKLSALFALDAFAGGLIVQTMISYWFHIRYGVAVEVIGSIFFGANILAGISALLAVPMAKRFGLINTMVFTHIPSNILLILVPLMPNLPLAIACLLARFSISQMDVPTRQSYTMAVVVPEERSAAAGVTAIARSIGASAAPILTGIFLSMPAFLSLPFYLCGGLKIVYDLLLFREFRSVKPPEEKKT